MRTGPHQTGSGHASVLDPRLGPVQGPGMFRPGTLGLHCGRPGPHTGGGVRLPFQRSGLHTWRSRTNHGGPDCMSGSPALPRGVWITVNAMEYITFSRHVAASDPPMWWSLALLWTHNSRLRLERAAAWSHTQHFYHATKG
jgi:hypothetical protein